MLNNCLSSPTPPQYFLYGKSMHLFLLNRKDSCSIATWDPCEDPVEARLAEMHVVLSVGPAESAGRQQGQCWTHSSLLSNESNLLLATYKISKCWNLWNEQLTNVGSKGKVTLSRIPAIWGDSRLSIPPTPPPQRLCLNPESSFHPVVLTDLSGLYSSFLEDVSEGSWGRGAFFEMRTNLLYQLAADCQPHCLSPLPQCDIAPHQPISQPAHKESPGYFHLRVTQALLCTPQHWPHREDGKYNRTNGDESHQDGTRFQMGEPYGVPRPHALLEETACPWALLRRHPQVLLFCIIPLPAQMIAMGSRAPNGQFTGWPEIFDVPLFSTP